MRDLNIILILDEFDILIMVFEPQQVALGLHSVMNSGIATNYAQETIWVARNLNQA